MKLLFESWRRYLEEQDLEEVTRASKEGVALPSTVEEIEKYIADDQSKPKYFMQFSDINKLGINPQSEFKTPLGVYSYPITQPIYDRFKRGQLGFATERKYIIIFKVRDGKNIIYTDYKGGIDDKEYKNYLIKLLSEIEAKRLTISGFEQFPSYWGAWLQNFKGEEEQAAEINKIAQRVEMLQDLVKTGKHKKEHYGPLLSVIEREQKALKELEREVEITKETGFTLQQRRFFNSLKDLENEATFRHNVGNLWNFTRLLAIPVHLRAERWDKSVHNPKKWRSILQNILGIDGIVDVGDQGLIHSNERTQAVFFSRSVIDHIATLPNKQAPYSISRREEGIRRGINKEIKKQLSKFYSKLYDRKPNEWENLMASPRRMFPHLDSEVIPTMVPAESRRRRLLVDCNKASSLRDPQSPCRHSMLKDFLEIEVDNWLWTTHAIINSIIKVEEVPSAWVVEFAEDIYDYETNLRYTAEGDWVKDNEFQLDEAINAINHRKEEYLDLIVSKIQSKDIQMPTSLHKAITNFLGIRKFDSSPTPPFLRPPFLRRPKKE